MAKEMIISCNGFERKIAILEDGELNEYYVERMDEESEVMAGNIYKGRVTKVLPGMQSAFVAIGLERDAFLYVADVFEAEEVEYESTTGKTRRPSPPKADAASARATPGEQVTDEDVEDFLQSIPQSETGQRAAARPRPAEQRDYDEQVAELIESLSEDLNQVGAGEIEEVDLKDAIIEEKLIEAVQREEMEEEVPETAPSGPDIRVGSLQIEFPSDTSLQRVVDEPVTDLVGQRSEAAQGQAPEDVPSEEGHPEPPVEPPSEARPETELAGEGAPPPPEDQGPPVEEKSQVTEAVAEPVSPALSQPEAETSASTTIEPETATAAEVEPEPPLEDADASLRHRPPRAEFANRRRPRRRRPERNRSTGGNGGNNYANPVTLPTITELLREGQELLVQIAKEPIGNKGARVTSHIALPGRFLVYMPTCEHIGVSRRIPTHTERTRLRRLASKLRSRQKAAGGFIVRTAAEGCSEADLFSDMKYLVRVWNDIRRRAEKVKAPALLYREVDVVERILRDRLSSDFTAIRIDNEEEYTKTVNFVDHFQPELVNRVKLYTRDTPIFEQYGVQPEIEKNMRPRVWLKSGGYIVINQTEALVAIDVNTGKFTGKTNRFEDTITRTNIEAAKEIARQLRLRDLGGIIVLDFIDMEERKNRQKVMQVIEEELKKDRAPAKVLSFNDFGLVAITRKRVKQSLERTLCEPCPYCHGSGMVKSPQTVCYEIFDEARRLTARIDEAKEVILRVHPRIAQALRERYPKVLAEIESHLKGKVTLETDALLHQEKFDIAMA